MINLMNEHVKYSLPDCKSNEFIIALHGKKGSPQNINTIKEIRSLTSIRPLSQLCIERIDECLLIPTFSSIPLSISDLEKDSKEFNELWYKLTKLPFISIEMHEHLKLYCTKKMLEYGKENNQDSTQPFSEIKPNLTKNDYSPNNILETKATSLQTHHNQI